MRVSTHKNIRVKVTVKRGDGTVDCQSWHYHRKRGSWELEVKGGLEQNYQKEYHEGVPCEVKGGPMKNYRREYHEGVSPTRSPKLSPTRRVSRGEPTEGVSTTRITEESRYPIRTRNVASTSEKAFDEVFGKKEDENKTEEPSTLVSELLAALERRSKNSKGVNINITDDSTPIMTQWRSRSVPRDIDSSKYDDCVTSCSGENIHHQGGILKVNQDKSYNPKKVRFAKSLESINELPSRGGNLFGSYPGSRVLSNDVQNKRAWFEKYLRDEKETIPKRNSSAEGNFDRHSSIRRSQNQNRRQERVSSQAEISEISSSTSFPDGDVTSNTLKFDYHDPPFIRAKSVTEIPKQDISISDDGSRLSRETRFSTSCDDIKRISNVNKYNINYPDDMETKEREFKEDITFDKHPFIRSSCKFSKTSTPHYSRYDNWLNQRVTHTDIKGSLSTENVSTHPKTGTRIQTKVSVQIPDNMRKESKFGVRKSASEPRWTTKRGEQSVDSLTQVPIN